MNRDDQFEFERSRAYWRHAPSGMGKHDTTTMALLPPAELLREWDDGFRRRFGLYPDEDLFVRAFARTVKGERILSIGSGLGLHEIYYQAAGASITCSDIVPSNLDVIRRVAELKGLGPMPTLVLDGPGIPVSGTFDTIFIYGALMHMPRAQQRELLRNATAHMNPSGRLVLMLYTWKFASTSGGWTSPGQFDPVAFGRASDPSVGAEDCPWADWHDDEAVLDLAGADFHIAKRQTWNQDFYVWYELRRSSGRTGVFFESAAVNEGKVLVHIDGDRMTAGDAVALGSGRFETGLNHTHYAAMSAEINTAGLPEANTVQVDVELTEGCVSVGLLDIDAQSFVGSTVVDRPGAGVVRLLVDRLPVRSQIIVSNHQVAQARTSRFAVGSIELRSVAKAEPPPAVGAN